ncbi:MAG: class I SAM-dependent methyltransferase [bacterium]|jgi:SAM-dependent methyltransferase|nr:class I SAM-dependent methyltransferase [bacterium]
MTYHPDQSVSEQLQQYYQTSERYRDDLCGHGEAFLAPYVLLVERYVKPPARILDLGCGTGLSTRLLSERGYETAGVDLSPLFLQVEKEQSPQTVLVAADAFRLPFPDDCFDAVAMFEFIEHIPEVPRLLDEILRVLKVHGFIVIHSPNLLSPYLPAFDLLRMLLGKEGRPVFAETIPQAWRWLRRNLWLSWKKKLSLKPNFLYREPDLSERHIGGDSDSVFLANPMDIAKYLYHKGCAIDQRGHAMSLKNKFIVTLTPNFSPYMGVVAHKRGIVQRG